MLRLAPIPIAAVLASVLGGSVLASGVTATTSVSQACLNAIEHAHLPRTKLAAGPPPVFLTSVLGVLRQPATKADALPKSEIPRYGYTALWIKYARLLTIGPEPRSARSEWRHSDRPIRRLGRPRD